MTSVTTNHELADICLKHNIPLVGVYSKNELVNKVKEGGYIINLSDSHDENGKPLGGTHWVAFWVGKQRSDGKIRACYFDSFGVSPPKSVQAVLKPYIKYPYCNMTIQNINSSVCGWYCLDFLAFMGKQNHSTIDKGFTAFLDRYSYNIEHNRRLLEEHLREHGIKDFKW